MFWVKNAILLSSNLHILHNYIVVSCVFSYITFAVMETSWRQVMQDNFPVTACKCWAAYGLFHSNRSGVLRWNIRTFMWTSTTTDAYAHVAFIFSSVVKYLKETLKSFCYVLTWSSLDCVSWAWNCFKMSCSFIKYNITGYINAFTFKETVSSVWPTYIKWKQNT